MEAAILTGVDRRDKAPEGSFFENIKKKKLSSKKRVVAGTLALFLAGCAGGAGETSPDATETTSPAISETVTSGQPLSLEQIAVENLKKGKCNAYVPGALETKEGDIVSRPLAVVDGRAVYTGEVCDGGAIGVSKGVELYAITNRDTKSNKYNLQQVTPKDGVNTDVFIRGQGTKKLGDAVTGVKYDPNTDVTTGIEDGKKKGAMVGMSVQDGMIFPAACLTKDNRNDAAQSAANKLEWAVRNTDSDKCE